jgi:hypothetical protein
MTNQSLYHAAGMGDTHQKVHVVHPEDEAGVPHPMVAIHADRDARDLWSKMARPTASRHRAEDGRS